MERTFQIVGDASVKFKKKKKKKKKERQRQRAWYFPNTEHS